MPSVAVALAVTLEVALSSQCQRPGAAVTGLGASTQLDRVGRTEGQQSRTGRRHTF